MYIMQCKGPCGDNKNNTACAATTVRPVSVSAMRGFTDNKKLHVRAELPTTCGVWCQEEQTIKIMIVMGLMEGLVIKNF